MFTTGASTHSTINDRAIKWITRQAILTPYWSRTYKAGNTDLVLVQDLQGRQYWPRIGPGLTRQAILTSYWSRTYKAGNTDLVLFPDFLLSKEPLRRWQSVSKRLASWVAYERRLKVRSIWTRVAAAEASLSRLRRWRIWFGRVLIISIHQWLHFIFLYLDIHGKVTLPILHSPTRVTTLQAVWNSPTFPWLLWHSSPHHAYCATATLPSTGVVP